MKSEICIVEFRAGSKQEIRQSLINYCQVPMEELNKSNIIDVYEKYRGECKGISNALWMNFHGKAFKIRPTKLRAWHYHKTGSNGSMEWFQKGLLNKSLGIKEFINNLYKYYDFDISEFRSRLIQNNDYHHTLWANDGPEYGPYSFVSRGYATESDQYNLPEVIERILPSKLIGALREKLKPTLVEFWFDYSINDALDNYIRTYCEMFLGESEDYKYSPFEPNCIIPYENIDDVKIVGSKKSYEEN